MSQYSANQHSTQTTSQPIAFIQNRTSYRKISRNQVKNVRSAIRAVKEIETIYWKEATEKTISK
jgi:hypothetical protein